MDFEIEPFLLDSHISLIGIEYEIKLFDLDSTLESKPTLKSQVDFFELIMVLEPITLEPELTIPPSHILLLDIGIDHDDSVMIFKDWSCKRNNFHDRILHDPIKIGDCKYVDKKEVNKGCLLYTSPSPRDS